MVGYLVESFDHVDFRGLGLPLIVVYEHPSDFPNKFVARIFDGLRPTNVAMLADTLEELREKQPMNVTSVRIPRLDGDNTCIVETWL